MRLVGEMGEDPQHPLRAALRRLRRRVHRAAEGGSGLRVKGEAIKDELLAHPALAGYLHGLWSEVIAWLQADLAADDSAIRAQVALGARSLGEKLLADPRCRHWINEQMRVAAPRWIERYREDIRLYIIARVGEWNAGEMTRELERNIGRDLQFIRINGTLVGGLVGLAIYTATQWARL